MEDVFMSHTMSPRPMHNCWEGKKKVLRKRSATTAVRLRNDKWGYSKALSEKVKYALIWLQIKQAEGEAVQSNSGPNFY